MLNIGICDDDKYELNNVTNKVKNILTNKGETFTINSYDNLTKLEDDISKLTFDLLILDIRFEKENSTSLPLAKKIVEIANDTQIIFITNYIDYFPTVYFYKHIYCILKQELDLHLSDALEKVIAIKNKINTILSIPLKNNGETYYINVNDILYLEKNLRKIKFIVRNNNIKRSSSYDCYEVYGKFEYYLKLLPSNFTQVHRSYIVNLNYIRSSNKTTLTLYGPQSQQVVPISRNFSKQVLEKINKYCL